MTELAGTQISNLLEALPGIAKVLRSPVADALVHLVRAASGQGEFDPAQAEELMSFAVRRNLMAEQEAEQIVAEARAAMKPAPKPKPVKPVKPAKAPKAAAAAKPAKASRPVARKVAKAKPARKAVARPMKAVAKPKKAKAPLKRKPAAKKPQKKK
ncbi:MAG: hypothetical protein AAB075_00535 [Gemmatimonadota bacterium]